MQAHVKKVSRAKLLQALPGLSEPMGRPVPERLEIKYRCMENNVPVPKLPKINRLTLMNFQFSFYACVFVLVCAFLVFAIEFVLRRKHCL